MDIQPAILSRKLLGEFIKSPETIRAFENLSANSNGLAGIVGGIQKASLIALDPSDVLNNERVLTGDGEISLTDGGPGGELTIGLSDTDVDAGTYGAPLKIPSFAVNAKGRLTLADEYDIGSGTIPMVVTEAYTRGSIGWKTALQVHLDDLAFGGPADETGDSSPALTAAITRLLSVTGGGLVRITGRRRFAASVTIHNGIVLEGESAQHGQIYPSSDGNRGATLILDPAATFLVRNGAGARNLMVKRDGLAYGITSAQVASTFTGTAFTLATNTGDHIFENLDILGFEYAVKSQDTTTVGPAAQNNRTRIFNVHGDCINGIWLHNAYDVPYIDKVHFWPYVTVGSVAEAGDAQLKRSGAFIKLTGKNDWTKVTNSFSFGYAVGCQVTDGHSVTFLNVSHDHPPGSTDGSKGYLFDGDASEIRVIGGQVAGKQYGAHVYCTTSSGRLGVTFSSTNIWVTTTNAIRIQGGSVQVIGGSLRNDPTAPNGIGIKNENTGTAEVSIIGVDFAGLATAIENQAATSILRYRNCTFRNVNVQIANAYMPSLASAATLVPNGVDEVMAVTGTTNFGTISGPQRYAGRRLTLNIASALTVLVGGNIRLKDNVNFAMAAGDTLTVMSDGTNWYEVARAQVNAWVTSFVPSISATTGTITTSSATCQYRREGALMVFSMNIVITTNGTGAGTLRATLPFSAASGNDAVFVGRDRGVGGKSLTATLIAGGSTIDIKNYDNSYPAADGSIIMVSGAYRAP